MAVTHLDNPVTVGGDDVPVVRWPAQAAYRDDLARLGRARLLVVEERHDPPASWDTLEDWVRAGVDPVEIYTRRELLRRRQALRAPAVLDEDGLLRRGGRWVAVSPLEQRVLVPLLARAGSMLTRAELLTATSPGAEADDRRTIDRVIRRLRLRLAPLGITIHTVRGCGFLLDMGALPD